MIKILIADDQELIKDSIKIILEVNPKYTITDTVKKWSRSSRKH